MAVNKPPYKPTSKAQYWTIKGDMLYYTGVEYPWNGFKLWAKLVKVDLENGIVESQHRKFKLLQKGREVEGAQRLETNESGKLKRGSS